jgi:hypothetical protein
MSVLLLSVVYTAVVAAFVVAYLVLRLPLSWSRRKTTLVIVVAALIQVAAFLFLILAGSRGWIP